MKFVPVIWFSACLFCCIQISAANPPTLETWSDFDQAVEDAYDGLINSTSVLPVGNDTYEIFQGYCLLSYGGEIESATNLFRYSPRMGIPAWTVRLTETQGVERVWLCEGEGSACFRTNRVPSGFNVRQWVDDYYGQVPAWLNAAEGDEWYGRRDRSRLRVTLSLIASNNWSLLADEWQSAMNNPPASQLPYRRAPSDKNRVAFTTVEYPGEAFLRFWIYSLTNPVPVEIYSSELLPTNGLWSFAGLLDGQGAFDIWRMPIAAGSLKGVYNAARGDIDSDGDGIPDGREVLVHGTSTVLDDSDGDGLSDLEELYRYETNPNQSDSDADSIPDGWEVNRGMNPLNPSDIYLDPDNDHLYNLHEYWIGSDPQVAETNSYAIADAMAAVDLSISGLVVATSINIFTTQDHSATNYLRNTNCWAAAYDLTCCSPWNSYASGYWSGVHHAGTLISPRHLLFAAHFDQIPTNSIIRFVDLENNVVERKLVANQSQHSKMV